MKGWSAALGVLAAVKVMASTAYVSDQLVLGVYADQNNQGQRLTTLHSGASVDALAVNGEFTQVRLNDGTTGWVKSAYLTTQEPATLKVKQLEEELDRSRATTPALAEAAARSELEQLKRELSAKQSELDARPLAPAVRGGAVAGAVQPDGAAGMAPSRTTVVIAAATAAHPWVWPASLLAALAGGFWLGYATLARRIKHKFGGIRVY